MYLFPRFFLSGDKKKKKKTNAMEVNLANKSGNTRRDERYQQTNTSGLCGSITTFLFSLVLWIVNWCTSIGENVCQEEAEVDVWVVPTGACIKRGETSTDAYLGTVLERSPYGLYEGLGTNYVYGR